MRRYINQMNVSITTNRTCNLKCEHCYINSDLFKNTNQLSHTNLNQLISTIKKIKKLDTNLEEIEWEVLGGETTLMPFEWWNVSLEYLLQNIKSINDLYNTTGNINFLTNLIIKDSRYIDLINKYGKDDNFSLYTSWEPDTNRFGKKNEKYKIFEKNLKLLNNVKEKIIDIIFTKEIINLGANYIFNKFTKLGITDFSFKMISPFGSGKEFFEKNMCSFEEIENFLIEFKSISKNSKITFTPLEEMMSSFYSNKSFQCNGNFYYDLSIEPEGEITFNANQTTNEAALPYKKLHLNDNNVEYKIIYENTKEANNKLELLHKECNDCKYLTYCNRGWYHYKLNQDSINKYKSNNSCSGLKKLWIEEDNFGYRKPILKKIVPHISKEIILENDVSKDYEEYFENIKNFNKKNILLIENDVIFGKNILERILFYDALNINIKIKNKLFKKLNEDVKYKIIKNIIFLNYKISVLNKKLFKKYIVNNDFLMKSIIEIKSMKKNKYIINNNLSVDLLNSEKIEMYLFILKNIKLFDFVSVKDDVIFSNNDFLLMRNIYKNYYTNIKNIKEIS